MSFAFTLAARYLRGAEGRAEGRRFLRLVTYIAVGGVAVGCAALLLSLMIVRGFAREIEAKVVGFGQHVQVESYLDEPLARADTLRSVLEAEPGVASVTPAVVGFALWRSDAGVAGAALWGTETDGQAFLERQLVAGGRFSFEPDSAGRPGVVLGAELARELGVAPGDRVTAFSMRDLASGVAMPGRPRVRVFHVAGLYETGLADFDEVYVLAGLGDARRLLGFDARAATRLDVTLDDITRADAVAADLGYRLGIPYLARSIYDVYANLFAWTELQKSIIPLLISVIVVVAAFNVVGTLLMVVLEKTREVGVLAAMGASGRQIRRAFLAFGVLIGLAGAVVGCGLALALGLVQQRFGIIPLPQEAYYLDRAPVELAASDFVLVGAVALVLCALAAYLPARAAARVDPIRAIRFGS